MDLTSITAALSGIKTAIEITKIIDNSSHSLEKAEIKYKLSEILTSLSETNIEIINIKETLLSKEEEIHILNEKLKLVDEVIKKNDAYYSKTENGSPIGEPYCLKCWEVNKELYHLIEKYDETSIMQCPICKCNYSSYRVKHQKGDTGIR